MSFMIVSMAGLAPALSCERCGELFDACGSSLNTCGELFDAKKPEKRTVVVHQEKSEICCCMHETCFEQRKNKLGFFDGICPKSSSWAGRVKWFKTQLIQKLEKPGALLPAVCGVTTLKVAQFFLLGNSTWFAIGCFGGAGLNFATSLYYSWKRGEAALSRAQTYSMLQKPVEQIKQERYLMRFHQVVATIAEHLTTRIYSLQEVLAYVAQERQRIASDLDHEGEFGVLRKTSFISPMFGDDGNVPKREHREQIRKRIIDLLNSSLAKEFPEDQENVTKVQYIPVIRSLNGKSIHLSNILFAEEYDPDSHFQKRFGFRPDAEYPEIIFRHLANEDEIRYVIEQMNEKFEEIQQTYFLNEEEFFYETGGIHWWLVQVMPFCRGTAAIVEMVISGLLNFKGFVGSWNDPPDIRALETPDVEQFAQEYRTLWEPREGENLEIIIDSERYKNYC